MNGFTLLLVALAAAAEPSAETAGPAVRFITTPSAAQLATTLDHAALVQDVVIEATEAVSDVRIEATPLSGPQVVALSCTVAGNPCEQPFDIGAHGARTVRLSGHIELAGTYRSVVSLASSQTRQSMMLTVTRTTTPFPLELVDPIQAAGTSTAQITIEVPLQEKLGREASLNPPALILTRQDIGKSERRDAHYTAAVQIADRDIANPWRVTQRSAPTLQLKFNELDEAGDYVGRLRLTSPSTPERLDVLFRISVKDGWFIAAVLIALGALLSFALRMYLKDLRPRLLQQRTTAVLVGDLERLRNELQKELGQLQDTEKAVVDSLSSRLSWLSDQIELGPVPEAAQVLEEVDLKLSLVRRWINARRRAAALTAPPATISGALEAIAAFLSSKSAQGADEASKKIAEAETAIRTALIDELNKRGEALSASIMQSGLLDDATRASFRDRLTTANALPDLDARREQLVQIEGDLILRFADALAIRIGEIRQAPRGFTTDTWRTLSDSVRIRLGAVKTAPAPTRATAYRNAYREYLSGVLAALEMAVKDIVELIEGKMQIDKRDADKRTACIADLKKKIALIQELLNADKLDDVDKAIRSLNEQLDGLGKGDSAGWLGGPEELPQGQAAPAAAAPPAPAAAPGASAFDIAGIALRHMRTGGFSPNRITRLIGALDLLVLAAGIIIGTASGVYLLWSGDPNWGTAQDKLVAVLWGLGLQRVSDTLFEGVGGITQKFAA
jgi:hypothetical protein